MLTALGAPHAPAPPAPFTYNWNAPHARSLPSPPPSFNGHPALKPLPLHRLKFNPLGLYELRRHLGIPGSWNVNRNRFLAGDLAWFASGTSDDNMHYPSAAGFFPEFDALRDSLPQDEVGYAARKAFGEDLRKLIFDLVTLWDRTFGSTTMVLHSEGTTIPGVPAQPEYLRATVYLPPAFLRRNPDTHRPIAQIAQMFIESVGVATVVGWVSDARLRNWRLTQMGPLIPTPNHVSADVLIPPPKDNRSAHYIFRGRPAGSVLPNAPPVTPAPPSPPAPADPAPPSPASSRYGSEEPQYSADAIALMSAIERISELEQEVETTVTQLGNCVTEIEVLRGQVVDAVKSQHDLQVVIDSLQNELATERARALSSAGSPPAYHPSNVAAELLTPTRPSSQRRLISSITNWEAISQGPLPSTSAILDRVRLLDDYLPTIRMMIKFVPVTGWRVELDNLGLDDGLVYEIGDAMRADVVKMEL
ncbi:hypothetical protein B0H11DRAFT_2219417 [Mycena galericulata]|nr:hypothetical protein B0H11DRAFT_2219417 [Mycena galericulata]